MVQFKSELLIDNYIDWYKNKITFKQLEHAEQIITPYLNHLNDRISIFIEIQPDNSIKLSDDGVTFNELELMAMNINTKTRQRVINDITNKYGLDLDDNDILSTIAIQSADFPQKKHNLIQGILALYDLLYTKQTNVVSLFKEEVLDFLFEHEFGGNASVKFTGESGIDYLIDYSLGATKARPNTLIKFQNNLSFANVAEQNFIAHDLKNEPSLRQHGFKYVMIIGDNKVPEKARQAAEVSDITIIPFQDEDKILALKK